MAGKKVLMKGNEALAEGAIAGGCTAFFGYPITPQNEIPEYMSLRMPEVGGVFVQSESEVAAVNMLYGAAACGARAMTSSSSPGISLKQEGISFLAAAMLPSVIANVQRGGPGLGNISASQSDYFQATRGGGHGDYRVLVYAPASVQEMFDLTALAFDKADEYRNPVMILTDGILGQIMEPAVIRKRRPRTYDKSWVLTGCKGRLPNSIKTLYMNEGELEQRNRTLKKKYERMKRREPMFEEYLTDDAELIVTAFGTSARVAKEAVDTARNKGVRAGLIRPITLFPFPDRPFGRAAASPLVRGFLTVEMNLGQMVEDVMLSVCGKKPVEFFGRAGGAILTQSDVGRALMKAYRSM